MSETVAIPETGQIQIGGRFVAAFNIWRRTPLGRPDEPEDLYVEIKVEDDPGVDVRAGDELELAGTRWRVESVTEDPEERRGEVVLARITQD